MTAERHLASDVSDQNTSHPVIATDRMKVLPSNQPSHARPAVLAGAVVVAVWLTGCSNLTPRFPQSILPNANGPAAADSAGNIEAQQSSSGISTAGHIEPQSAQPNNIQQASALQTQGAGGGGDPYVSHQFPNPPLGQPGPVVGGQIQGGQAPQGGSFQGGNFQSAAPNNIPPPVVNSPVVNSPPATTTVPGNAGPGLFPRRRLLPGSAVGAGDVVPGLGPAYPPYGTDPVYSPTVREADLIINGFPARTGRIMFGGAVNSDAGVTGQITIDERNFDIRRWPRSFQDLFSGTAFRGNGETFRIEAAPGNNFDRYSASWATPNLLGYLPLSFSVSGFLFDRRFDDWDENRLGMRLGYGYRVTPDLSLTFGFSGQRVKIDNARATNPDFDPGPVFVGNRLIDDLAAVSNENRKTELYGGRVGITHNTRDSPIQPSMGHYFEFEYEKVFGDFDYSKFDLEFRQYWLLTSRADGSGKQTLSYSTQLGFTGDDTPIFDRYYAGGYATLRGFDFRGVGPRGIMQPDADNLFTSPVSSGINVGGQFQWVNSIEYMFPITADDAFRGVVFTDFGTVESSATINEDNFRVAPGFGLRVAIPALGPAPLAFDYAFPIETAEGDEERPFSFYMSLIR